ncbi:class I SAM-dependent methyltransferase [Nannocystis radixulma]|uniref:Class I SAM-dependent methyltransferase n=1 Tax=Nannocystis radixulma TaxID=2995305 RepID=A0ABT5BQH9_9BACT|nr:class I SAM-dependent methyltransferase [Nannocystis radixulma]MDC0675820.1 class I SAM-dependent methyltransferase [Nannocystis radixulma]
MSGGYDDGYKACNCFWGTEPGSLVRRLEVHTGSLRDKIVLDVGCGEGKNAAFLAQKGAYVRALDISAHAVSNAQSAWPTVQGVTWEVTDIRAQTWEIESQDVVVAYGLFHCFSSEAEVNGLVRRLQSATKRAGVHVICAFNDRFQELEEAHPGFSPLLLPHVSYLRLYGDWEILESSDENLTEVHPHNGIRHTHSLTRLIARRK